MLRRTKDVIRYNRDSEWFNVGEGVWLYLANGPSELWINTCVLYLDNTSITNNTIIYSIMDWKKKIFLTINSYKYCLFYKQLCNIFTLWLNFIKIPLCSIPSFYKKWAHSLIFSYFVPKISVSITRKFFLNQTVYAIAPFPIGRFVPQCYWF